MFRFHAERKPTRLVFVRHLPTEAVVQRDEMKSDGRYQILQKLIEQTYLEAGEIKLAYDLGASLLASFPLQQKDSEIPLLPGQRARGQEIGRQILTRHGKPHRWEVSPYQRTRDTSEFLREGMRENDPDLLLPVAKANSALHEKSFGASDQYPSSKIFLALHPKELVNYVRRKKEYKYPQGESEKSFKRRIGKQVKKLRKRSEYEGRVSVFVAHSLVIEEFGRQLTSEPIDHHYIPTGSVTVFEAPPKRFLRRRQFRLVGQAGQLYA